MTEYDQAIITGIIKKELGEAIITTSSGKVTIKNTTDLLNKIKESINGRTQQGISTSNDPATTVP